MGGEAEEPVGESQNKSDTEIAMVYWKISGNCRQQTSAKLFF